MSSTYSETCNNGHFWASETLSAIRRELSLEWGDSVLKNKSFRYQRISVRDSEFHCIIINHTVWASAELSFWQNNAFSRSCQQVVGWACVSLSPAIPIASFDDFRMVVAPTSVSWRSETNTAASLGWLLLLVRFGAGKPASFVKSPVLCSRVLLCTCRWCSASGKKKKKIVMFVNKTSSSSSLSDNE